MPKITRILFILSAALFSLSTLLGSYTLDWLIKLLPMFVLLSFVFRVKNTNRENLFFVGLIFSVLGDFFLGLNTDRLFLFGLASFLIAHLFYLLSLWPVTKKHLAFIFCYVVYGTVMLWILAPSLGELLFPVVAYMGVLLLMGIFTLLSNKSNPWLIVGGLSFILSDSLLGINRFYHQLPYSHFLIMVSYYFAQYSLVRGIFDNLFYQTNRCEEYPDRNSSIDNRQGSKRNY